MSLILKHHQYAFQYLPVSKEPSAVPPHQYYWFDRTDRWFLGTPELMEREELKGLTKQELYDRGFVPITAVSIIEAENRAPAFKKVKR